MESSAMRVHHLHRIFRPAAAACVLLLGSAPAFAQRGPFHIDATIIDAAAQQSGASREIVRQLSIDDAVKSAIEQNLGIRIQRIDPQIQDLGIAQARSFWAPTVNSQLNRVNTNQPAISVYQPQYASGTVNGNITMAQSLPWGGSYTTGWINQRVASTNPLQNFTPEVYSNVQFNYTQPLLQNFSIDQIRQQVQNSKKVRDMSDVTLRSVIIQTTRAVRDAYWDLVYAINNLKVSQLSLELSQQFLKDNEKRVEIGTLAPIDIVQAQAEVASNEQGVIVADAAIKTAQDNLRTLILDPGVPEFWNVTFDPTDAAEFTEESVDVDAAVRNALDKRTDIQTAKDSLDQSDINIKFYKNQVLPAVNLQANYGAISYGGTQLS